MNLLLALGARLMLTACFLLLPAFLRAVRERPLELVVDLPAARVPPPVAIAARYSSLSQLAVLFSLALAGSF